MAIVDPLAAMTLFCRVYHISRLITVNGPNRLRYVLSISSHVTMSMGSFGIMLLLGFMAKFCIA